MNPKHSSKLSPKPILDILPPPNSTPTLPDVTLRPAPSQPKKDIIQKSVPPTSSIRTPARALATSTYNPISGSGSTSRVNTTDADDAELDAILKEVKPNIQDETKHVHKSLFGHRKPRPPLKAGAVGSGRNQNKPGSTGQTSSSNKPVLAIVCAVLIAFLLCGAAIAAYQQS